MQNDIKVHGMTDRGKERPTNEDQFLVADLCKSMVVHDTSLDVTNRSRLFGGSQGTLLLVADGIGGHASGERASALAVETLNDYVLNYLPWLFTLDAELEDDFEDALKRAVRRCDETIVAEANTTPGDKQMGSTLTMAYVVWPRLYVVHVGDSRCYVLRDDTLDQVTRDHTLAQRLVETGDLDPAEAEGSRESHVLLNALGGNDAGVQADVYKRMLKEGDTLLLCTDGLTAHVSDEDVKHHLRAKHPLDAVCQALVDHANRTGGSDNVTVVVARVPAVQRVEEETMTPARRTTPTEASAATGAV